MHETAKYPFEFLTTSWEISTSYFVLPRIYSLACMSYFFSIVVLCLSQSWIERTLNPLSHCNSYYKCKRIRALRCFSRDYKTFWNCLWPVFLFSAYFLKLLFNLYLDKLEQQHEGDRGRIFIPFWYFIIKGHQTLAATFFLFHVYLMMSYFYNCICWGIWCLDSCEPHEPQSKNSYQGQCIIL